MSNLSKVLTDRFNEAKTAINSKYQIAAFMESKGFHVQSNKQICCPFHDDSTPSFSVNTSKNIWKCFGCSDGGHFLDFWIRYQNKYESKEYSVYRAVEALLAADESLQTDLGFNTIFSREEDEFNLFKAAEMPTGVLDFDAALSYKVKFERVQTDSMQQVIRKLRSADLDTLVAFIADCENGMPETQLVSKYYREQDDSVSEYIKTFASAESDTALVDLFKEALDG